jgi:hypothetical protein
MGEVAGRGAKPGLVVIALWTVVSLLAAGLGLLLGGFASPEQVLDNLPPGTLPAGVDQRSMEGLVVVFKVVGIGLRSLLPFVYWPVLTLVMYLVTRFFGGESGLSRMFGAMGVACVPFVISGLVQLPIMGAQAALASGGEPGTASVALGAVGSLLNLAFLIWHVVLVIVGAAVARRISYGRSGGSCAIGCAAVIGIPILLLIVFGLLLAVFGGAGG